MELDPQRGGLEVLLFKATETRFSLTCETEGRSFGSIGRSSLEKKLKALQDEVEGLQKGQK